MIPFFLDIDGVLQSTQSILVSGAKVAHVSSPRLLLDSASPMSVELLLRLQRVHFPDIQWFIASSWCDSVDDPAELVAVFDELGFKNATICPGRNRVQRVQDMLATMPAVNNRYAIIDDSHAFKGTPLEAQWIDVDPANGFDGSNYYQTLIRLGAERPEIFMW